VVDGDTLRIGTDNAPIKVRVIGIDTPETMYPGRPVEAFGPEATERAREVLDGRKVRIHYDPDPGHDTWDKYGRL
jgi:micrococcal nuclease